MLHILGCFFHDTICNIPGGPMKLFTTQQMQEFSDLDYSIYNFVIANPEKIAYMTIRELADEAHVSTASITRFCQKVDCDGYSEFKIKFKMQSESTKKMSFSNDLTSVEVFLNRMREASYESEIHEVAQVLADAKSLIFVGTGNSGIMAEYASRYFSSVGKFALHVINPMFQLSVDNPEDTVFVFLSVEGELATLIDNLTKIKALKSTIVSITNSKKSTLAKMSDYNLSCYVQREHNKNTSFHNKIDVTTQVPVMLLLETLAKEVHDIRVNKKQV